MNVARRKLNLVTLLGQLLSSICILLGQIPFVLQNGIFGLHKVFKP